MFGLHPVGLGAPPVHISCDISLIAVRVLKIPNGRFLLISQTPIKDLVRRWIMLIVISAQTTIVHEDVAVAT